MSITYLKSKVTSLKTGYNASRMLIDSELKREHQLFGSYDSQTQERLRKEKSEIISNEYKEKFKSFVGEIKSEKTDARNKVKAIRFPNLMNRDNSLKAFGETQISSALIFLSRQQKSKDIINSIKSGLEMNRIDFASQIISSVMPENILQAYFHPSESNHSWQMDGSGKIETVETDFNKKLRKEIFEESFLGEGSDEEKEQKKELFQNIVKILDEFPGRRDWDEVEKELQELKTIEEISNALSAQLNEGRNKIEYFTRREANAMDQKTMNENLDAVMTSMTYWPDSDSSLAK
jgi:hypothetical protein